VTIPQPSDDSIENIGVTFLSASYRREIASALRAFEKLSNHLFRFVLTRVQLVSSVHFIDRFDADIFKSKHLLQYVGKIQSQRSARTTDTK